MILSENMVPPIPADIVPERARDHLLYDGMEGDRRVRWRVDAKTGVVLKFYRYWKDGEKRRGDSIRDLWRDSYVRAK